MPTVESTASPKRRRLRRPRNADPNASTRVDIMKSAAKAFRRLGYHGATVEQIAAALKMKKGNLYYYFKNKEAILFACHQYSLDELIRLLEEVERSGLSADEKLRRLIVAFVHTILDELHGTALFLDLEALSAVHLKAVIARRDTFDRGVRRVLEEGMATGTFGPGDAKTARLRALRSRQLDPAVVQPGRPRELAGDRRSLRRFSDRRTPRETAGLTARALVKPAATP
jgi:AcrR family transcriptional regulator